MRRIAIVGGGLSGMATALLLQSNGFSTILIEAHTQLGGCAGFYVRNGFSFDVGATTLVDFHEDGLGGQFLSKVGIQPLSGEFLPGYMAWLPDREIEVARNQDVWSRERVAHASESSSHKQFWALFDDLANTFWPAARRGLKMPIRNFSDLYKNWNALQLSDLHLAKYLRWSVGDALNHFKLSDDKILTGLLSMMIEDTVNAELRSAPLINAALGVSIRGAGLARPKGGMRGFWRSLAAQYVALGGTIKLRSPVSCIEGTLGNYVLHTHKQTFNADQVVCALPVQAISKIAPNCLAGRLKHYIERDEVALGGGLVLCIGSPEDEVAVNHRGHRHHQILQDYDRPLGNGNNMFISVSEENDMLSAPKGCRAVMVSTHCKLDEWEGLNPDEYRNKKQFATDSLLGFARRVYPQLGKNAKVTELGTPSTYEFFCRRPRGAIGGARLSMKNSNQYAIPYDLGRPGFWLVGDTTWPGLGTVACILGANHVADGVCLLSRNSKKFLG